jgi:hypothetical protein
MTSYCSACRALVKAANAATAMTIAAKRRRIPARLDMTRRIIALRT